MIADTPEMIEAMKQMGRPASHGTRGRFSEFQPNNRLEITQVIDFLPGVKPYESTIVAEFFPSGESVRMVITLDPMHDEEFTKMSNDGLREPAHKAGQAVRRAETIAQVFKAASGTSAPRIWDAAAQRPIATVGKGLEYDTASESAMDYRQRRRG
jgi:hypothetical protein